MSLKKKKKISPSAICHRQTQPTSNIYSLDQPNLFTTLAPCSGQLCGCTQGESSRTWTDPAEYWVRLWEKRSGTGTRLITRCGLNARSGRGASRGRMKTSYCLSLGSMRSFSIGKSLFGTMKQMNRPKPLWTEIHSSLTLTSKQEELQ